MKQKWSYRAFVIVLLCMVFLTGGCAEKKNTDDPEGGIYLNEELKFSFYVMGDMGENYSVSEDDWTFDVDLYLDRKTVNFYMNYPQGQAKLFSVHVFNGEFDENDLSQANPHMKYLAYKNQYTYTVEFAEEIPNSLRSYEDELELYDAYMKECRESFDTYIIYDAIGTSAPAAGTEEITVNVDGTRETVVVTTYVSNMGFCIGYDAELMAPERNEGEDKIVVLDYEEKKEFPEVSLSVSKMEGLSVEDTVAELALQYNYTDEIRDVTIGKKDYEARSFSVAQGDQPDSQVTEVYVMEYEKETYVIKINYFNETAGNYGSRLHALLYTLVF